MAAPPSRFPWILAACVVAGLAVGFLNRAPEAPAPAPTRSPAPVAPTVPPSRPPPSGVPLPPPRSGPRPGPRALPTTPVPGLAPGDTLRAILPAPGGAAWILAGPADPSAPARLLSWRPGEPEAAVLEPAVLGRPRLRAGKLHYRVPAPRDSIRVRPLAGGPATDHPTGTPGLTRLHFVYPDGDTVLVDAGAPPRPVFVKLSKGRYGPLALPGECADPGVLGVLRGGEVVATCAGALVRSDPYAPVPAAFPVVGPRGPVRAAAPRRSPLVSEDAYLWPLVLAHPGEAAAEVVNLTPHAVGLPPGGLQRAPLWTPGDDTVLARWREEPGEGEAEGRAVLTLFSRHTARPARSYPSRGPEAPPLRWADRGLALWAEGSRLVVHDLAAATRRAVVDPPTPLRLVGAVLAGDRLPTWQGEGPSELVWLYLEGPKVALEPTGGTLAAPPRQVYLGGVEHGWYLWLQGAGEAGTLHHLAAPGDGG